MKNTDISWRAKIGNRSKSSLSRMSKFHGHENIELWILKTFFSVIYLAVLLIIGGIEINPGPTTFLSTSNKMIKERLINCKGNNNPIHAKSRWGSLSMNLYGINTLQSRTYLKDFGNLKEQQITVSPEIILAGLQKLQLTLTNSNHNTIHQNSAWGMLSTEIFGCNTIQERKYLSELWSIYEKVVIHEDMPINNTTDHGTKKKEREKRKRRHNKSQYRNSLVNSIDKLVSKARNMILSDKSETTPTTYPNNKQLAQEFRKSVNQFATEVCKICNKKIYPSLHKEYSITWPIMQEFRKLEKTVVLGEVLIACRRCHGFLSRGKISPLALCNNLELGNLPAEIECLNDMEVSLIKQVKIYMKVILLNEGKGQKAIKGMVVHFPLEVDDVIEHLPLRQTETDVILVTESFENIECTRHLQIRPKHLYDALKFLISNNPLYQNIKMVERSFSDFEQVYIRTGANECPQEFEYILDGLGYEIISDSTQILRGTISQSHPIFGEFSGMQCTAMAASFISHSAIDSPGTWTRQILDEILTVGNSFYAEKRPLARDNYLTVVEVEGSMTCFQGVTVQLHATEGISQINQGYLNKFKGAELIRLPGAIKAFMDTGGQYGIITVGVYSMGLYYNSTELFLFDSHSRGKKGALAQNGVACVLKYSNLAIAPMQISNLLHKNCQPKNLAVPRYDAPLLELQNFMFSINKITVEVIGNNELSDSDSNSTSSVSSNPISPNVSPVKKKPRNIAPLIDLEINSDISSSEDEQTSANKLKTIEISKGFGMVSTSDCVIDADDYIEPEIDQVTLKRKANKPLNAYLEKNLDLLAFPHLFPYGKNGINENRTIKLSKLDYFQQRLMSNDKRFAGNTEFLFYALSETDRFRVQEKINVCCSMKKQDGTILNSDSNFILDPHFYMGAIRGTHGYWKKYTGDVIAMIKTLGIPTFFLTFSFDDLNSTDAINAMWKAKHGSDAIEVVPQEIPYDIRKKLLNDYPIAAARHFSMRLSKFIAFIKKNAMSIFGAPFADFTVRVEFQSRGSPHAHMLIWLENVPKWNSPEGKKFIDLNVSCSLAIDQKDIVLKYQRHRHNNTCLKRNNSCRFHFPMVPQDETTILSEDDIHRNGGKFVQLKRTAEEAMINNYHPILLPILKCNMDIQPVTGAMAIAYYIAKYISKGEPKEIRSNIQEVITRIKSSEMPIRQKMQRIAMTLMRNREISAQEAAFRICHLLLRQSSRATVFIPTFKKENRIRMLKKETVGQENPEFCLNIIDRYMSRPVSLEQLCLMEFASHYAIHISKRNDQINDDDVDEVDEEPPAEVVGNKIVLKLLNNKGKIFKRTKPAVIKFPNFNPVSDMESYYYSLILLYFPFRVEDFCDNISSADAFRTLHNSFRTYSDDPVIHSELGIEIDRALLRITDMSVQERSQINLDEQVESIEYEEVENEPINYNEIFHCPEPNVLQVIQRMVSSLNVDQKKVFDNVKNTFDMMKKGEIPPTLRYFISGDGGVGKSFLIQLLSLYIKNYLNNDSVLLAGPTGKSAHLIGGITLHRAFALPVETGRVGEAHKLSAKKLGEMRTLFRHVQWIIIDETSMVSYETFRMISNRLCEIKENSEPFGGCNILCFGDLFQLKPVRGSWIFKKPKKYAAEEDLWRMLEFHELTINQRQNESDPLLRVCRNLRIGEVTQEDIAVLQSRLIDRNLPDYEQKIKEFSDALWVFPTLKQSHSYNVEKSKELSQRTKIYTINAQDTYAEGSRYGKTCDPSIVPKSESKTGGFQSSIELGKGSRVMLRRNIDTKAGIVNGAVGTILDFKWTIGNEQMLDGDLPKSVLIKFDHLSEPQHIECKTVEFYGKKQTRIMRRTIPLVRAWAINIHKVQGQSCSKIVVCLGKKTFAKGMAYVAISRARTLSGLAIIELDMSKILTSGTFSPADMDVVDEYERLRGQIIVPRH